MFQKIFMLTMVLFITGCASFNYEQPYSDMMATWSGESQADMLAAWGQPTKIKENSDGTKELSYINTYEIGGDCYAGYGGQVFCTPTQQIMACETTFTIDEDGMIDAYSYSGRNCHNRGLNPGASSFQPFKGDEGMTIIEAVE